VRKEPSQKRSVVKPTIHPRATLNATPLIATYFNRACLNPPWKPRVGTALLLGAQRIRGQNETGAQGGHQGRDQRRKPER
jgi:hypothetical protein